MARIVIQSGALSGKAQEFTDKLNIGRDQNNDLVLLDKKISGKHALIYLDHGHYLLMDLDSTNGTKLNGNKIAPKAPTTLRSGDRIEIEGLHFSFEEGIPQARDKGAPAAPASGSMHVSFTFDDVETIKELAKWMRFLGTYFFILGIVICLSIIGAIIGWLPIVLGLMLREAGSKMLTFASGSPDSQFLGSMAKLKDYFKWNGVIAIIYLVALGLVLIGLFFAMLAGLAAIPSF